MCWIEKEVERKLKMLDGENIPEDIPLSIYQMIQNKTDISILLGEDNQGRWSGFS